MKRGQVFIRALDQDRRPYNQDAFDMPPEEFRAWALKMLERVEAAPGDKESADYIAYIKRFIETRGTRDSYRSNILDELAAMQAIVYIVTSLAEKGEGGHTIQLNESDDN